VTVHELSRLDARRIAVRAQLLDRSRPAGLLDVVRRLTLLQIDPVAAIAPNADLVAWSRIGSSYAPAELDTALADRQLLELRAMIRPSEDLALYRADMAHWDGAELGDLPGWRTSRRDWVRANDTCRLDILDRLGSTGPLPSRELPDTCKVPWQSTGWTNNRNVTQLLEHMVLRGEVSTAGRRGRDRLWDLATRIYPDTPVPPADAPYKDFCDKGGRFGPHNTSQEIHNPAIEQPGKLIDVAWFNAGLRIFDVSDSRLPKEVGSFMPPERPNV